MRRVHKRRRQPGGAGGSLCGLHWRDGQRRFVLPAFVRAGAEERIEAFAKDVVEGVHMKFGFDVIEGHLQNQKCKQAFLNSV